ASHPRSRAATPVLRGAAPAARPPAVDQSVVPWTAPARRRSAAAREPASHPPAPVGGGLPPLALATAPPRGQFRWIRHQVCTGGRAQRVPSGAANARPAPLSAP